MKKSKIIFISFLVCVTIGGCSPVVKGRQDIPEVMYTEAGYAVKSEVEDDGTVKVTYALVGLKDDKIEYLRLDQVEQNPSDDKHLATNRELENAYGLAYEGDHGEWNEQITALENYISGNSMSLDEVNNIPMSQKVEGQPMVPEEGSELETACELDLTDFLEVINEACANTVEIEATRLALGEDIRVSKLNNQVEITFAFVGTDYRYKISYAHLDVYSIVANPGISIRSLRESTGDEQQEIWKNGVSAFESYILGLNMKEAYGVETYDPGNGIDTALPKLGTDLEAECSIDLEKFILVLREAADRL